MNQLLTWQQFGHKLLFSGDLDPVYIMLTADININRNLLKRWCLAYWCFYHVGVASDIAMNKSTDYWCAMSDALKGPRGTERRHFRGDKAVDALHYLERVYGTPETVVDYLFNGYWDTQEGYETIAYSEVMRRVKVLPQFGPWIGFKIADMGERVLGVPVDFSDCALDMYRDPKKGAALVYTGDQKAPIHKNELLMVVDAMLTEFSGHTALGLGSRPVNLQEIETVLCKYKSYHNRHYPPGKDTAECIKMLEGRGELAEKFKCVLEELI